jgi:hypothetical protein
MHDVTYSSLDDTLQASGIQIAKVLSVGNRVSLGVMHEEILEYCRTCEPTDLFIGRYQHSLLLLDAFTETLVSGVTMELGRNSIFCSVKQLRDQYTQFSTTGTGISSAFLRQIRQNLQGRSFFTTAGGYFGISPLPYALVILSAWFLAFNSL